MANEVVGVQIKVDSSQATKSLGEIRKEIKQANADLINAQQNFGDYSAEALAAAKKVATLKDSIKEAAETADLFDPGNKFKAFAGALSAVAGGFSAVQGAVGLLGVKSEEVEKSILKVQSALALSQGLSTVADSAKDFQRLAAVVKTNVVTAFSTLRGAIIATGIGALAVGLGLLIANFDKVKKVVLELIPGLGKVADFIGNLINKVTDFIGVTSDASRATAKLIEDNNKAIKEAERFLDLNADKYDEYTQRKIKANLEFKKKQNEFLADETLSETQKIEFVKQARDKANREIIKSDADRNEAIKAQNKKAFDEQKALREKAAQEAQDAENQRNQRASDAQKIQTEAFKATLDDRARQLFEIEAKYEEQRSTLLRAGITDFALIERARLTAIADVQKEFADKEKALADEARERRAAELKQDDETFEFYQELNKKTLENEKKILDARLAAQLDFANAIGAVFGGLSQLFEQGTAAAKIAGLAEIAIGTGTGFINALSIAQSGAKATGPAAPFAFPIFYASQLAAVLGAASRAKNILSTVKGGGSTPSVSAPRFGNPPIQAGLAPTSQTFTTLNPQSINQLGSATNRAYVVESDISNSQERITRINRAARLA